MAWLSGFGGARLSKKDWKRLLLALLAVCAYLGIPALQIYLLTTLELNEFAHRVFIYILVPEYVIAIFLTFSLGSAQDVRRNRRDARALIQKTIGIRFFCDP